jgi:hypothetical protein
MGDDQKINWIPEYEWKSGNLTPNDQLILEEDMLGQESNQSRKFAGCTPLTGEKFVLDKKTVWISSCNEDVLQRLPDKSSRIVFNPNQNSVASRYYNYGYKSFNQMLFDKIETKQSKLDPASLIAEDSDLYIRADVKNFFTLNFHSDELESKLEQYRIDNLIALANLSFYLRVLFFKLSMDLKTDVAFFEDSAYIPMVLTLPVNAGKHLHRKSGVLYSFRVPDLVAPEKIVSHMPILDPSAFDGNYKGAASGYCSDLCKFSLTMPTKTSSLTMELALKKDLVDHGLFPWFVSDVSKFQTAMKWKLPSKLNLKNRVGLYFEMSEMPKGSHPWDFWITFK